ncbi:aminoglycoside phosphotransferase [Natronococcus pandeyae]|uniref:Aminoglycoside phosphotransferase n=1 Tax=Natronococcus pandeyae TaxID=2055836 RepID=A0A8J8TRJ6_9EURY|nr:aminoglycoside phosphotransferase family protein [Natronococcus pandeyae]TYL39608.1 aminoglycoside phosphotransferase [Natronococcus pandeyae]
MTGDVLERIVEAALETELRSSRRPAAGSVADTVLLDLADEPTQAVCKRGGRNVWTGDVIEPLVLELVGSETDLPVPAVLASGSLEGRSLERDSAGGLDRWALYEFLPGENPGLRYRGLEPTVRRRLVREAGELLGRLHATPSLAFDHVGGLARDGATLRLCEPNGWHAIDLQPAIERLPVPLAGDPDCRPVLTHGDYQPSNLLTAATGEITGVLDWGNAHVTHAEYALARAEARFVDLHAAHFDRGERDHLRNAFRTGYTRHARVDPGIDRRLPIYKLLWIAQSGANYGRIVRDARGRRQLWRQCRRLLE